MELSSILCYNIGYETLWNCKAAGEASPAHHPVAGKRQNVFVGCSKEDRMCKKFCFQMVEDLPEERRRRTKTQTCPRTSLQINKKAEKGSGGSSPKRPFSLWFSNRPLDIRAYRQCDLSALWHSLSSQPRMAYSPRFRMELSEAREAGPSKKRGRNKALETAYLASYKKKPKGSRLIWSSSTKVGSSLSQTSNAPGHLKGEPLISTTTTGRIEYLPLMLSQFLPNKDIFPFISDFIVKTLQGWKWSPSLNISLNTCGGISLSSGIGVPSTNAVTSGLFFLNIQGFMKNSFHHMLQSLTLQSISGVKQTQPYPTLYLRTYQSLNKNSRILYLESETLKSYYGHAFMLPIYHGGNDLFH